MADPKKANTKRVEKLTEKGNQHLRDEDYDAALTVAGQLRKARFTAAFEIAALAHAGMGDLHAAIAVLEEGVGLAPNVWLNWQLLGNYRSDLKRYEDAASAYEAALRCQNVNSSSVHLNQAILANRRGQNTDALEWAEKVTDPAIAIKAISVRIHALSALGRPNKVEQLAARVLGDEEASGEYGSIAAALGWARLKHGVPKRGVRTFAVKALNHSRGSSELLSLIREIDNEYSRAAKYWRMLVEVRFPRPDREREGAIGYYSSYDVVAANRKEALGYIQLIEKVPRRFQVIVTEADILEPRPEDPKGVYRMSGRCYFVDDR